MPEHLDVWNMGAEYLNISVHKDGEGRSGNWVPGSSRNWGPRDWTLGL